MIILVYFYQRIADIINANNMPINALYTTKIYIFY